MWPDRVSNPGPLALESDTRYRLRYAVWQSVDMSVHSITLHLYFKDSLAQVIVRLNRKAASRCPCMLSMPVISIRYKSLCTSYTSGQKFCMAQFTPG